MTRLRILSRTFATLTDFFVAFLPLWLGVVAASITGATAPRHAPRDFFEVGAQIVVVLLLGAAVESRLLGARRLVQTQRLAPVIPSERVGRILARVSLVNILVMIGAAALALVLGEINALQVLASAAPSADPSRLFAAIVFGMVSLTLTTLLAPATPDRAKPPDLGGP
jgi:hypothetical protein